MIKNKQYKDWSLRFHRDHSGEPIAIQMELTYGCPLRCLHCYSDCYNNRESKEMELSTKEIKSLIDKFHKAGCLWLTFTGGDPMQRADFIELYNYAKSKGFILSVMTSLSALNKEILKEFVKNPPFAITMTLNAVTEEAYEKISQVKGSFKKVMRAMDMVLSAGVALEINTLVSKNNIDRLSQIKAFVESKGLAFNPSHFISARLNGDTTPCSYRLPLENSIPESFSSQCCDEDPDMKEQAKAKGLDKSPVSDRLFNCLSGRWMWHTDPYGRLNICIYLREPYYDLLRGDLNEGISILSEYVKNKTFTTDSECKNCRIRHLCLSCPANAKLEIGGLEAPIPYFCSLAKRESKKLSYGKPKF